MYFCVYCLFLCLFLQELTVQFILRHSLPGEYFAPLLDYITQTQKVCMFLICLPTFPSFVFNTSFNVFFVQNLCDDLKATTVGATLLSVNEPASQTQNDLDGDLVNTVEAPLAEDTNLLLSELDDLDPSAFSANVDLEEEESSILSHASNEVDIDSPRLSEWQEESEESNAERSPSPESHVMLALEHEFQEYLMSAQRSGDCEANSAGEFFLLLLFVSARL